ncbi:lipoyl protein ligase domain-containing protein [Marivita sp.]|uniref:lipoyl protein ligase domain-containing protein n=1 Tax=Marivita sp. TaxID=2003365 RepID=UPI003A85CB2D
MIVAPFATAADGIAREAALLQAGRPALLLWQADARALVLPTAVARRGGVQPVTAGLERDGLDIVSRGSGGGIVPQGPCTLNLAMVLPCVSDFAMQDGYHLICGAVAEALTRFDISTQTGACPGSFCDGAWNVLVGGRKLAGTAQRWRSTPKGRVALLHAAIMLHMPDPGHWADLCLLHQAAFPDHPALCPEAHAPLNRLMPGNMSLTSVPGALIRAAEDRLFAFTHREDQAA